MSLDDETAVAMVSVKAPERLCSWRRSSAGFAAIGGLVRDRLDESLANLKANRTLAGTIVRFVALCHVVTIGVISPFHLREDPSGFLDLVLYSSLGTAVVLALVLLNLGLFRNPHGVPEKTLNLANRLTIVRFVLVVPVVVLLLQNLPWLALTLYVVSGITDIADGIAARRKGQQTHFGVMMDPAADILSTAGVFTAFLVKGFIPLWVYAILLFRYLSLLVGSVVLYFAVGPVEFKATPTGKIVGVLQAAVAILIIILSANGMSWQDPYGDMLYPFLGMIFCSVVVSQLVIGVRHIKEGASDAGS